MADTPSDPEIAKIAAADDVHSEQPPAPKIPYLDAGRMDEVGEVHLIYQIEGKLHEVPVFELSALRRNPTTCPKGQLSQRGGFWLA
jgi:hypothetical protein